MMGVTSKGVEGEKKERNEGSIPIHHTLSTRTTAIAHYPSILPSAPPKNNPYHSNTLSHTGLAYVFIVYN